jgi:hypothetical protein
MAMTVIGGKPVSAAQSDPRTLRHPLDKDDLELNATAQAWLASLDESVRPRELVARFPRIVNRIAKLWKAPLQMDRCFEELLTDTRGTRQGFPLGVLTELSSLKDYYGTKVFPTRNGVWDS